VARKVTFFIITGDRGKVKRVSVSKVTLNIIATGLILLFSLTCFLIYDYRVSHSQRIELSKLREKASKQQQMLSFFEDKFQRVEAEVSRLRVVDSRIKKLIKIQEPKKTKRKGYVGGKEIVDGGAYLRGERIVDLRIEDLEKGVLVNLSDLEGIKDMLEFRLEVLESLPSIWPVRGIVSSGFGVRLSPFSKRNVFHRGLDIMARRGSLVRCSGSGKVIRSGLDPTFGNIVVIDHGYGYRTIYAHLSEILVNTGDIVKKGNSLGRVGSTGRSTGPHLHFEIRLNGVPVNPTRYLG